MTGLEKIIAEINNDAEKSASAIAKDAKSQTQDILAKAKQEAAKQGEKLKSQSDDDVKTYIERAKSAAQLAQRQSVLSVKQQLIDEVIKKAQDELLALGDKEYFDMIVKLAAEYAWDKDGEICLNAKDIKRAPKDLEKKINDALKTKGAKLTLSGEPKDIDGGFVLIYGGIEENCSVTSMFGNAKESLQDKVHEILFA